MYSVRDKAHEVTFTENRDRVRAAKRRGRRDLQLLSEHLSKNSWLSPLTTYHYPTYLSMNHRRACTCNYVCRVMLRSYYYKYTYALSPFKNWLCITTCRWLVRSSRMQQRRKREEKKHSRERRGSNSFRQ